MRVIDLTHTIKEDMPVYPGTGTPKLLPANSYEENGFKETLVSFYSHTGTHVDPPAHLFADRTTLDAFAPEQFLGKALVIDCTHLREGEAIGMKELSKYGGKADAVDFLLFDRMGRAMGDRGVLWRLSLHRRGGSAAYSERQLQGHRLRRDRA